MGLSSRSLSVFPGSSSMAWTLQMARAVVLVAVSMLLSGCDLLTLLFGTSGTACKEASIWAKDFLQNATIMDKADFLNVLNATSQVDEAGSDIADCWTGQCQEYADKGL